VTLNVVFTVRLHVMQCMVYLGESHPVSVCWSICQIRSLWQN